MYRPPHLLALAQGLKQHKQNNPAPPQAPPSAATSVPTPPGSSSAAELRIFKPWFRYQLLEAKLATLQAHRRDAAKGKENASERHLNDLRVQTKRILFKIHTYQDLQNKRVQEMFTAREEAFDILEAIEHQEQRIAYIGKELAMRDLDCKRGLEDHVFMRTGLRKIDHDRTEIEDEIIKRDNELAREAAMCNQLETAIQDFITHAVLSLPETQDWSTSNPETSHTSAFLKKHSPNLQEAMAATGDLVLSEFCAELQGRRKKGGEREFTVMERFEKEFYRHLSTFADERDDELLLKELFQELVGRSREVVE